MTPPAPRPTAVPGPVAVAATLWFAQAPLWALLAIEYASSGRLQWRIVGGLAAAVVAGGSLACAVLALRRNPWTRRVAAAATLSGAVAFLFVPWGFLPESFLLGQLVPLVVLSMWYLPEYAARPGDA